MLFLLPIALLATIAKATTNENVSYSPLSDSGLNIDENYLNTPSFYPTPQGGRLYDEKWAIAYEKARLIVDELTITEKVNLTTGIGYDLGRCSGNTGSIPRLNFSTICLQDGPVGVRNADFTTVFPAGLAVSSTFNKQLLYDRAVALGAEFKGKGVDAALGSAYGPIGLKPQGGRGWEGHGPDAYLEGVAAYLEISGMQSQGVMATAKHLVGNEQEHYRYPTRYVTLPIDYDHNITEALSSEIDDRALHELYLWPFAEAVRAGVASVMCSYNQVNGTYACQNSYLLNYILKEELGFQGYVVSDWGALYSGVDAAAAGLDMNMGGEPQFWGGNLTLAALNGSLPLDRLDDMATRILASLFYVGAHKGDGPNYSTLTFDSEGPEFFKQGLGNEVVLNGHIDVRTDFSNLISLKTAIEAVVLLKNENEALPLKKSNTKRIGVFGQAAGEDDAGVSSAFSGFASGAAGMGYGSGSGTFTYLVTPHEGISTRARQEGITYEFVRESWAYEKALKTASYVDAAIVVANNIAGEELAVVDGNTGDLNNFTLWHNAENLIKNISSINNNTIVVLTTASQVDLEKFIENENITAVIYSSYLGQDYGTAIAKILFGDENPSGKLPFTFAKSVDDYVPLVRNVTVDRPVDKFYEHSIFVDYKYFDKYDIDVRYEFGHGLSYSNFILSDISIDIEEEFTEEIEQDLEEYLDVYEYQESSLNAEEYVYPEDTTMVDGFVYPYINDVSEVIANSSYEFPEGYTTIQLTKPVSKAAGGPGGNPHLWDVGYTVSSKVTNNGPYYGGFVSQLYVKFPESEEFPTPPVQLRGFDKLFMDIGQTKKAIFELTRKDLSVWDTKSQTWKVLRGEYKIYVGSSSRNLELVETITLV